jgi:hypothetical protein
MVIERFLDRQDQGLRRTYYQCIRIYPSYHRPIVMDCIVPPDLNEARVRKCLLALTASKIVRSDNSTVSCLTILREWPTDLPL